MKKNKYEIKFGDVEFKCACGYKATIKCATSILGEIVSSPICINCHSVNKKKIIDDDGRMKRFMKRYGK